MTKLASVGNYTRKEGGRFVKFMIVGGVGFIVDAGTLFIATSLLHLPDLAVQLLAGWPAAQARFAGEMVSQAISFTVAVISNFTWNRLWTYPESRSKRLHHQLVQFFLVNLAGLGIRSVIYGSVLGLYRALGERQLLVAVDPQFFARYAALATAVGVVLLWNFFVNRYWTYNDVD
jgi:putative flippase GtrA